MTVSPRLRKLLREPLFHFILLGAALFGLHRLLAPSLESSDPIVVSDARVLSMVQTFARTWQRPPTENELERLIDDYVRTEVFVREALVLGLDRDDLIVRRRLRQKMEFLLGEGAPDEAPTAEVLQAFLDAHRDRYRVDSRVSFSHLFLDPARRGDRLAADAERLLNGLSPNTPAEELAQLGDPIMALKPSWKETPRSEIVGLFGSRFADALWNQPMGRWTGPLSSAYGVHLVYVDDIKEGSVPKLDEIRYQVEDDWRVERKEHLQEAAYQRLLEKYRVQRPVVSKP